MQDERLRARRWVRAVWYSMYWGEMVSQLLRGVGVRPKCEGVRRGLEWRDVDSMGRFVRGMSGK